MPQARGDVHHCTTELEPFVSLQTVFPTFETAWSPPSEMCTWCLPCLDRKTGCMTESHFFTKIFLARIVQHTRSWY